MTKLALHWKILIGMALGIFAGLIALWLGSDKVDELGELILTPKGDRINTGAEFVVAWVKPFGDIFINALKLIAVPLIIASLIKGVTDLKDLSRLSSLGGRTIGLYLITTSVAVFLGLGIALIVKPGKYINPDGRDTLIAAYADDASGKIEEANKQKSRGPLQPLVDLVPENLTEAAANNRNMLQVITFALFFGVGLLLVPPEQSKPVKDFFDSLNEIVLKLIDLIMLAAPVGVFALMASMVVQTPSMSVFWALLVYFVCVSSGLAIMVFVFYPALVLIFLRRGYAWFFRGLSPAQFLAFSTSSSAATLPVTMERVEEHLGVDEEVASFVLPIGATVNMDGTSLYQGVAAVFICQAFDVTLSVSTVIGIALTCILASIGTAAVPSAGVVMLVVVLGQIPTENNLDLVPAVALILALDRLLDMMRTVVNVTSDATVSMLVAKSVGMLGEPHPEEWDDYYHHKGDSPETPTDTTEPTPPSETSETTDSETPKD
ncbi:dicarboxylate/amino acid:cation symporter [Aeoliella mucimassa]|uniref:Proton glutamate symport protein n=1 Tax=Aeoliella mucimassa TaxID=2527972 RepID=A0A518AWR8_9BACT|nr:dicarboxylate/amino acid:cation symporter [Aeoliella mucimassa]QDU59130.1 Proton glutamate symport protein [Aeoliella mucimassa]